MRDWAAIVGEVLRGVTDRPESIRPRWRPVLARIAVRITASDRAAGIDRADAARFLARAIATEDNGGCDDA